MSSRKVVQAPDVRRSVSGHNRRPQQTRGVWDWILGEVWG